MTYKESNPTFNTNNRKVFHFSDFCNNIKSEEEELKKVKRSFVKTGEYNFPSQTKYKWNKVTRKMDDLSQDMVDGKIDAIEDMKETKSFAKNLDSGPSTASQIEQIIINNSDPRVASQKILNFIEMSKSNKNDKSDWVAWDRTSDGKYIVPEL